MTDIGSLTGQFGSIGQTIVTGLTWLIFGGAAYFVSMYIWKNANRYPYKGEIWEVDEYSKRPIIDEVKGGRVKMGRIWDFQLNKVKYKNFIVKINPNHIVRKGKKRFFWLRRAGEFELYSFVPTLWTNILGTQEFTEIETIHERKDKFGKVVLDPATNEPIYDMIKKEVPNWTLQVETNSIRGWSIIKDKERSEMHGPKDWLARYGPTLIPLGAIVLGVIMIYYSYKWSGDMVNAGFAAKQACQAIGGY